MLLCFAVAQSGQLDTSDGSRLPSNETPLKPVARRPKATTTTTTTTPAGLNEMILRQHTAMFQDPAVTSSSAVKPPVPTFRRKNPAVVKPSETEKLPASSELSVALSKVHRRAHSSGDMDTERTADRISTPPPLPVKNTSASPQPASAPTAEGVSAAEKPVPGKPMTTTKAKNERNNNAQKSEEVASKSGSKPPSMVEKMAEKLSIAAADADKKTLSSATVVEMAAPLKVDESKPKLPAKMGAAVEKAADISSKTGSSRVLKPTLSAPGSTVNRQLQGPPREQPSADAKAASKCPAFEVRLRSTRPSVVSSSESAAAPGDSSLTEGRHSAQNGELVSSVEPKRTGMGAASCVTTKSSGSSSNDTKQMKQTSSAQVNDRTEWTKMLKKTPPASAESTATGKVAGSEATASASGVSRSTDFADRVPVSKTWQAEGVAKTSSECGVKLEQTGAPDHASGTTHSDAGTASRQAGFVATKANWQLKSTSSEVANPVAADGAKTDVGQPPNSTAGDVSSDCFVPVSKRASVFGPSLSTARPLVKKSSGQSAKSTATSVPDVLCLDKNSLTELSQSTDAGAEISDSTKSQTVSDARSVGGLKSVVVKADSASGSSSTCQSSSAQGACPPVATPPPQPPQQGACEAKNEVVIKAASAVATLDQAAAKPVAVLQKVVKSEKQSQKEEAAADTQLSKPEQKASSASAAGSLGERTSAAKSSASSWVKSSSTPSPKNPSRDGSTAEPGKTSSASGKAPSVVPSWVKPSATSSPKNSRGESPSRTADLRKIAKFTSEKSSDEKAAAAKQPTADSLSSVPKTTVGTPSASSSAVSEAAAKLSAASTTTHSVAGKAKPRGDAVSSAQPAEPPWIAISRQKTRVWTDGSKVCD